VKTIKFALAAVVLAGSVSLSFAFTVPRFNVPTIRVPTVRVPTVRMPMRTQTFRPAVRTQTFRPAIRTGGGTRIRTGGNVRIHTGGGVKFHAGAGVKVRAGGGVKVRAGGGVHAGRPHRGRHVVARHRPLVGGRRTVLPAGIAFNAGHRAGKGLGWTRAHVHGPLAFYWHLDGHRWHRWYYPWWIGPQLGWYWYDTPADTADEDEQVADDGTLMDSAGDAVDDSTLPTCSPDSDDDCTLQE
jgi:hypothetical protein